MTQSPTRKILVVDNSRSILRLLEAMLTGMGHEVRTALDGLQALEILRDFAPHLIFLDLVMPNINGEKLCRIIRQDPRFANTFIVILSAVAAEQQTDCTSFGANACIAKGPSKTIEPHIRAVIDHSLHQPRSFEAGIRNLDSVFRRQASSELLDIKRHFELTLDHLAEGFLECTEEFVVILANPAVCRLTGLGEEQLLSRDFFQLFDSDTARQLRAATVRLGATPLQLGETDPVPLGNRLVSLRFLPIPGEHQTKGTIIVILQDITARKQAERELARHREQLEDLVRQRTMELESANRSLQAEMAARIQKEEEKQTLFAQFLQAQKMESLGRLAGGVAHDFNNIVSAILGYSQLAIRALPTNSPAQPYIKTLTEIGERAGTLTRQLLSFSRKKDTERRPLDLGSLVEGLWKIISRLMGEDIILELDKPALLPPILADSGQIEQILMNLAVNARDAMPRGGHFRVRLEGIAPQPGSPAGAVRLIASDTGTGIPAEHLTLIFEPFFTTKAAGKGTGLGLATVWAIVHQHAGTIRVDSTLGVGTVFTLEFPGALQSESSQQTLTSDDLPTGSETICVVEDDLPVLDLVREILASIGYAVLPAEDGHAALRLLEEHPGQVHLLLTDLIMPGMNGKELAEQVMKSRPGVRIILMSGYTDDVIDQYEIRGKGLHFLPKPLSPGALARAIRGVLDGSPAAGTATGKTQGRG